MKKKPRETHSLICRACTACQWAAGRGSFEFVVRVIADGSYNQSLMESVGKLTAVRDARWTLTALKFHSICRHTSPTLKIMWIAFSRLYICCSRTTWFGTLILLWPLQCRIGKNRWQKWWREWIHCKMSTFSLLISWNTRGVTEAMGLCHGWLCICDLSGS